MVACRDYLDGYRRNWAEVLGSFVLQLEDIEEGSWKEFARRFKREGFGLASTGADVGRRFAELVSCGRDALDFSEWMRVEDQDFVDPQLRDVLNDKVVQHFEWAIEPRPISLDALHTSLIA